MHPPTTLRRANRQGTFQRTHREWYVALELQGWTLGGRASKMPRSWRRNWGKADRQQGALNVTVAAVKRCNLPESDSGISGWARWGDGGDSLCEGRRLGAVL